MIFERQIVFWGGAVLVFALVLWLLNDVLLPFVLGAILAYLFDPLADRLERLGLPRLLATLLIVGLVVFVFVLLIVLIAPILAHQIAGFVRAVPGYVQQIQRFFSASMADRLERVAGIGQDVLQDEIGRLAAQGAAWLGAALGSIWNSGQALASVIALLVVTPVVAAYLLYDWDRMVAAVDSWLPRDQVFTIRRLARDMNEAVAGFVRGQFLDALIMGVLYAVALTVVGLNFALLVGLAAGLLGFIPFVGFAVGLVTSVGMALLQFWPDWHWVLVVLAVFLAGQAFEGNILQPWLVGRSTGLHPVALLLAILAFGSLFGFLGLLLAVPAAAAIAVLIRFALERYLASPYYRGRPDGRDLVP